MGTPLADFLPKQYTQPLLEKTLDAFLARTSHALASLPTTQLEVCTNLSEEVPICYRTGSEPDISNCEKTLSTQLRSTAALRWTTRDGDLSATLKRHNTNCSSSIGPTLGHFDGNWTNSFVNNPNGRMRSFPMPKQETDCELHLYFF